MAIGDINDDGKPDEIGAAIKLKTSDGVEYQTVTTAGSSCSANGEEPPESSVRP